MFPWLSTLRKDRNSDVHAFARAYYGGPACGGGGQASRLSHDESRRNRSRRPPTSSAQPSLSHAGLTGRSPDRAGRSPRYVALGNAGRYYSATGRSAGGDFPLLPPEQPSDDGKSLQSGMPAERRTDNRRKVWVEVRCDLQRFAGIRIDDPLSGMHHNYLAVGVAQVPEQPDGPLAGRPRTEEERDVIDLAQCDTGIDVGVSDILRLVVSDLRWVLGVAPNEGVRISRAVLVVGKVTEFTGREIKARREARFLVKGPRRRSC